MPYILAAGEFTVPLYSSRSKTSPQRRQTKSSTPSTFNSSPSFNAKRARKACFSTIKSSTRSSVRSPTRSTTKQESDIERESLVSSFTPSLTNIEVFPAPEPVRPVFCCTTIEPNERGQAHTLGNTALILQRGHLRNFLEYTAEYSLSNAVPEVEDLTWSESADYLVRVLQYREEDVPKSESTAPLQKKRKIALTFRKGKTVAKQMAREVKWEQANPGRYFVEVKHVKGQRRSDHAIEEILVTEGVEGIPTCFKMVDEITMEAQCSVHSNVKWVCEFWAKIE